MELNQKVVFALVNRKGGVSKTTSSAYISMCLYKRGYKVTGIDADSDESWLKWSQADGGTFPYEVIAAERDNLVEQIDNLQGCVVIDTPPNDGEIIYDAASIADEVIIPLSPTGLDVNRLATTISTVANVERMRGKPLASVLLTRWREGLKIGKEVTDKLQDKSIPLLDSKIRLLTRYEGFSLPTYLDEYEAVLNELGVFSDA